MTGGRTRRFAGFCAALLAFSAAPVAHADQPAAVPTDGLMLDSIDPAIDPCEDFYRYACHGWLKRNPVPADESSWDIGAPLADRNDVLLRTILDHAVESAKAGGADPGTMRLGDYWQACMDEASIEAKGLAPLRDELDRIAQLDDRRDLPDLIAHLHRLGVGALFAFSAGQDYHDATRVIAELDQGGLGLPVREYYLADDRRATAMREAYVAHLARMDVLATGVSLKTARARARSVLAFETDLAEANENDDERIDPRNLYHPMTLAKLRHLYRRFDWAGYLAGLGLREVPQVNLVAPHYLQRMAALVAGAPLAQIRAYLTALLLDRAADLLPARFAEESFRFYDGTLRGARQQRPRWKRCVTLADSDLGDDLGRAYVATAFDADSKAAIADIVARVRAAFREALETVAWMGAQTRAQARAKLDQMVVKIGYPDHWHDDAALEIKRDDALGNSLRAASFQLDRDLARIGKPVDRAEWSITPATVNAYYDDQKNDITFPAGTLQPPYFDRHWDDAVNYGAIGATIGHEMTHGFDDSGRMFDSDGNLRDWWTHSDAASFESHAQCLVDEYSAFAITDTLHLNGQTTLGENTADNGGTRLAYLALERKLTGHQPAPIDGYSAEQRFFIAYAQSFCENQTAESEALQALSDPHATAPFRVNGVVRNMPEFHKAFQCRADQKLVPARICRVW